MKTLEDFATDGPTDDAPPYPYEGPESLRHPILDALTRVVDPEVAMSIVDVGLIYGVTVNKEKVHVLLTMTSAACPVTDVIKEEVEGELDRLAPPELLVHVELVWDPPWTIDRMSERARKFMGW
jgi:metal-sulfur cluster biosynthetic enzyme